MLPDPNGDSSLIICIPTDRKPPGSWEVALRNCHSPAIPQKNAFLARRESFQSSVMSKLVTTLRGKAVFA